MDTKTMWWNSHNHSKWAFICKYNCTIKGLELNVVLKEKLHGLDALSPYKLSLLFILIRSPFNWKLFPPGGWWLQHRGIFLASLQNLRNWGLLGLQLPSSRAGYILYLQANNYKLQILSFSIINLLSSASSSSSSLRISSAVSSWARRAAVVLPIGSDFLQLLEWVPISDLPNKWWLSTTNYYPSEITAQFVTSISCSLL